MQMMKDGYGQRTYKNGDTYQGWWKDGKRHGPGTYTFASGIVYEGEWRYGKKLSPIKRTYTCGSVRKGHRKNNTASIAPATAPDAAEGAAGPSRTLTSGHVSVPMAGQKFSEVVAFDVDVKARIRTRI